MFTGIIQDIGTVSAIDRSGDWVMTIVTPRLPLARAAIGASIACNGMCLTVIALGEGQFTVQISMESLAKTTAGAWDTGTRINLETALRMGDELGGHLLSGHIDGVATLIDRRQEADSLRLTCEAPPAFARFLAAKGSIAIDGVSLTVNEVNGARFGVNIIPHTQVWTTLAGLQPGMQVNFEVDTIARYVERMLPGRIPL